METAFAGAAVLSRSKFTPVEGKCSLTPHRALTHRSCRRARTRCTLEAPPTSDEAAAPTKKPNKKRQTLPTVAVIGRPNVGKSTLVNRITGAFQGGAIVADVDGVTRDRTYKSAFWNGVDFTVVDTGGLVFDDDSIFLAEIRTQALIALSEASAAILVVDSRAGVTPLDSQLASFLRKECKDVKVHVAVNKCEGDGLAAAEFWKLGLGEPVPISAIHGVGTGDLLDGVVADLPVVTVPDEIDVTNVAIVGRPNVGKSSLLNVMLGVDRAIVSDIPGTTRDAVDERVVAHGQEYRLIDTAGIRRRTNVEQGTEYYMVNRAFKAIRRSDVVLLLVDVNEGAAEQDRKIADRVAEEGRACVILANKWDLVDEKDNKSYKDTVDTVRERLACIPWATVELISAKDRQRTGKVLQLVDAAREQHQRRVSTAVLNEVLRDAVEWHKAPGNRGGKQGRIYYCTQVSSRPPTIAFFVNDPRLFTDNYRRYMEGKFRTALGFGGTPIRILWRGKSKAPSGY